MLACRMLCKSNSSHLSQVFTGFALLRDAGKISFSQECGERHRLDVSKPQHLRDARNAHVVVLVNRDVKLYYDCHDSCEIDETAAREVDYYFKRSYAESEVTASLKGKVFPLGLNYPVWPAEPDRFERQRRAAFKQGTANEALFRPTIENMFSAPDETCAPGVLFVTRAWEPFDNPERADEKIAERVRLNETRARCVELLRRELGEIFFGGFSHTDYAVRNFPHVLLPDKELYSKERYVEILRRHPICVATAGLHGSIGWKMGEYVAFSKAIVSERLGYRLPGDFEAGENYLEFDEPRQCLEGVRRLLSDAALRRGMMKRNHGYYLEYLKPDAMVERTLSIALSGGTHSIESRL